MNKCASLLALLLCVAFSNVSMATEDSQDTADSSTPIATSADSVEETPTDATPAAEITEADSAQTTGQNLPDVTTSTYTAWFFRMDVTGVQREPALKNSDKFKATIWFGAEIPHAAKGLDVRKWQGIGSMSIYDSVRVPQSDQANHKAAQEFLVRADSAWIQASKAIIIYVHPEDKVTYSLLSGPVLGTDSILRHALVDAHFEGLSGTALAFAISDDAAAASEYHCTFNTRNRHTCWYEGEATLTLVSKTIINNPVPKSDDDPVITEIEQPVR